MRVPKQKHNASSKQAPQHSVVGKSATQPGKSPQQSQLIQTLSRMGNTANAGNHAAILNRAPDHQQSANKNLLLHLQRQYGNSYVNQVVKQAQHNNSASTQQAPIQTKLTIGPVGDKYEREADRTAVAVVERINAPTAVQPVGSQAIQREKMPEEELQKKPQISAIQREVMPGEEQQAQMKPAVELVQAKKPEEEDKQKQAAKKTALAAPHQPKKIKEEDKKKLLRKQAASNPSKSKKQEEDDKLKHLQKKSDAIAEHSHKEEDEDKLPIQKKSHPDAGSTRKPEEEDKLKHLQKKSDTHAEHGHKEEEEDKLPVQKKSHPGADPHKKPEDDDDKHLMQAKSEVSAGHQDKDEEDKMAQMQPLVQRRSGEGGTDATTDVENSIKHARGKGRPLPDHVRNSMENAFGADFSGVKIHADIHADKLNRDLQARAFTTKQDVFFRHGEFALGSKRGQELLAHELTHVVQQNGSAVQPKSLPKQEEKNKENQLQSKTKFNESTEQAALPEQKPQARSTHLAPTAASADTSGQGDVQQQPLEPEAGIGEIEIQRREAAGDTAPNSPEADPGYQEVVSQAQGVGTKEKEHQPAEEKSQEAQEAAEPPSNEVESKAQDKQVDEMEQAPTPPFDPAAFKKALMDKIKDAAPKNLEEADKFKDSNKLESVKNDVTGKVDKEQKDSQGPLEEKTKATPDTSGITPKPVTPLPANQPGETPSINGAEKAAPKSKGQSQVEAPAQARSQSLDQQLAGADITEEQLAKSNEPQFQGALDSKKTAQTHSQTAPQVYRQGEQSQLSQAESTAAATAQEKLQGMHGYRSQSLEQVTGKQVDGKGKDEQSRAKIAGDIDKIYQTTKTKVDAKLAKLTTDVGKEFDAGAAEAKKGFEDYVGKRMDAYKADRYTTSWSNPFGWAKWVNDKLWGMPEEVNRFYEEGRDLYIKNMDGVIDKVVAIVGTGLTEAKNDVADGRKQVKEYVAKLPEDLKEIGVEAAENIQTQFDGLEQDIQNKQDELIDTLAQKYKENLDAIDARIKEMQEENKGLIQKAIDFIVGVIKTIIELAKMLLEVLARVASVIGSILKDPIGFLSNLFNALKLGFNNFVKNIGKYLMQGLLSWLTGALAGANIQMPTSLDPQGIFSLVIQVLGVGYDAIRAKAVKRMGKDGEQKVGYLEKGFEMFRTLATKGVAGVWQVIKERLGDIKTMVLDPIMQFLIENVIQAGVQWIIGLMSPASAFIKACKAIYDIVKFFMEHAQQIADLINSILDAIALVASGAIDKAAQAVEDSLAKAIPVAIGFLASILGLGGISEKVQAIIQKMRQPIDKAIDWAIDQGVKAYKKVSDKLKKSKLGKKFGAAKKKAKQKLKAAKQWGKNKQKAAKHWFEKKKAAKDKFKPNKKDKQNRSRAEIQEDLSLAQKEIAKVIKNSTTTEEIRKYFPAIQKRFGLKRIAFKELGTPSGKVIIEINPQAYCVLGTDNVIRLNPGNTYPGLPAKQDVVFKTGNSKTGEKWGIEMEAKQLGPNHPKGFGPTEQRKLMLPLPTSSKNYPNLNQRFIRGHLLNDNLGGPGLAENLFPITAQANAEHHDHVESLVKQWVNDQGYFVYYHVEIRNIHENVNTNLIDNSSNYVNSEIHCEAYVISVKGNRSNLLTKYINRTINSVYSGGSVITNPETTPITTDQGDQSHKKIVDKAEVELSQTKDKESKGYEVVIPEVKAAIKDYHKNLITNGIKPDTSLTDIVEKTSKEIHGLGVKNLKPFLKAVIDDNQLITIQKQNFPQVGTWNGLNKILKDNKQVISELFEAGSDVVDIYKTLTDKEKELLIQSYNTNPRFLLKQMINDPDKTKEKIATIRATDVDAMDVD